MPKPENGEKPVPKRIVRTPEPPANPPPPPEGETTGSEDEPEGSETDSAEKLATGEELQRMIEEARGIAPERSLVRTDPGQILAELTNHVQTSMGAQAAEITRLSSLLTEVREQRTAYKSWIGQITTLDNNAIEAEKELVAAIQAAHFAHALLNVQRVK